MILPPERDDEGKLREAKNVQGALLPLLQDMQRFGPCLTTPMQKARVQYVNGSLPLDEIGEVASKG